MSIPNEKTSDDIVRILDLPFSLDPFDVAKRIKFRGDGQRIKEAADTLTKVAVAVARPKALYRTCKVNRVGEGEIDVEGTKISSRVLNKLFIGQDTAFPYIVTIGPELAEYNISSFDMMTRFWLDNIKEMVLHAAGQSFSDHLQKNYTTTRLTHMNPGEIDDWPITQQRLLFSLLDDAPKQIGVRLTDGGMLNPVKSRSGIYFPNNNGFETCRLCTQLKCPGRRAAYNANTVVEYTGNDASSS